MKIWRKLRLRIAQRIFPDLLLVAASSALVRTAQTERPMSIYMAEQHAYGDRLRALHAAYEIAVGRPLIWKDVKERVHGPAQALGLDVHSLLHYDALQLVLRLARHPDVGCRKRAYESGISLFRLMWPSGVTMPDPRTLFPNPQPGVSP